MAKGKGIYKRTGKESKNGKPGSVYWLTYVDAAGKIVRKSSGTSDYKEAVKELTKCRNNADKGKREEKAEFRKVLFTEAMDDYLKWAKPQRAYDNKEYMKEDLVSRFGNIPLKRFSVSMLEAYLRIPEQIDHSFRRKLTTDSTPN